MLLNTSILPREDFHEGQPYTITSTEGGIGVRDFEADTASSKVPSVSQRRTTGPSFVFSARDADDEFKVKHPALQVSIFETLN